nr:immunoglobulin heavy chain junction region [Macaca mulatta]
CARNDGYYGSGYYYFDHW